VTLPYALLFYLAQVPLTDLPIHDLQPIIGMGGWSKMEAHAVHIYSRYKNAFVSIEHCQLAPYSDVAFSLGTSLQLHPLCTATLSPNFRRTASTADVVTSLEFGFNSAFIYTPKENALIHLRLQYNNHWHIEFRQLILLNEQWSLVGGWRPHVPDQSPLLAGINFHHEEFHAQYLQQGRDWSIRLHFPYRKHNLSIGITNALNPLPAQWSAFNLP